jgi:hypothetical protein
LPLPHDPQPLAWVVGFDKSSEGKKDLLELEKLNAFKFFGLERQSKKTRSL